MIKARTTLLLPMAAVLETGNHIAQLPNGNVRRSTAKKFCEEVSKAIDGTSPAMLDRRPGGTELSPTDRARRSSGYSDPAIPGTLSAARASFLQTAFCVGRFYDCAFCATAKMKPCTRMRPPRVQARKRRQRYGIDGCRNPSDDQRSVQPMGVGIGSPDATPGSRLSDSKRCAIRRVVESSGPNRVIAAVPVLTRACPSRTGRNVAPPRRTSSGPLGSKSRAANEQSSCSMTCTGGAQPASGASLQVP